MQKQGSIVRWDSAKGFGFIRSPQTDADVFFHVRDWRHPGTPAVGQQVIYEEIHVGSKGPRAMDVRGASGGSQQPTPRPSTPRPVGRPSRQPDESRPRNSTHTRSPAPNGTPTWLALAAMLAWVALLVTGVVLGRLDWIALPIAFALNLVTFFIYWQDKHAARQGHWRTPENTLHLFGLLGGWPGAWFAHQILRHKSSKQAFRNVYWLTVGIHLLVLAGWVLQPWR